MDILWPLRLSLNLRKNIICSFLSLSCHFFDARVEILGPDVTPPHIADSPFWQRGSTGSALFFRESIASAGLLYFAFYLKFFVLDYSNISKITNLDFNKKLTFLFSTHFFAFKK